ncbi:MAG: J domain-containing protein [Acidobacteriota bacterium]|nr:J domain-containing protein [Acidobacteriota bacterium]
MLWEKRRLAALFQFRYVKIHESRCLAVRSYYDELGVPPNASADEIRDTYRNLVRLLHPDQQLEGHLKDVAEHQLKRINYVHQVLSDSEKRRRYDAESAASERPVPLIFHAPPPPPPPRSYRGTVAWVVAALLCGALISWLINRESFSSFPEYAESVPASPRNSEPEKTATPASLTSTLQAAQDTGAAQRQIATLRGQLRASDEERATLLQELVRLRAESKGKRKATPADAANRSDEPSLTATVLPPPSLPALNVSRNESLAVERKPDREIQPAAAPRVPDESPRHRFSGVWFYAKPRLQKFKKAFYPPEYIEANIVEENGAIHGRYRARYQVTDRAISPDVNFEFDGKANGGASASLPWSGGGGAKGEVQLKLISETSLEVVWSATQLGRTLGLAAGSAVLVRRVEP